MEKKVRVKRLNHQDDIKRSWTATYLLTEDSEGTLSEDLAKEQSRLDSVEDNTSQIQPPVKQHDTDISAK